MAPPRIVCPDGYQYNPNTKMCDWVSNKLCPVGQYYDTNGSICRDAYIGSPSAANLISSDMPAFQRSYLSAKTLNPSLKDCVLPAAFYDPTQKTCVECPSNFPYFNVETYRCQNCGDGTYSK